MLFLLFLCTLEETGYILDASTPSASGLHTHLHTLQDDCSLLTVPPTLDIFPFAVSKERPLALTSSSESLLGKGLSVLTPASQHSVSIYHCLKCIQSSGVQVSLEGQLSRKES